MEGKCKYCGEVLKDKSNIRCDICNDAWQDGVNYGVDTIKEKLRTAFGVLKSIIIGDL